jgi:hypothetical protein
MTTADMMLCRKQMDRLPDEILLKIFDLAMGPGWLTLKPNIESWQTLVHVCRRWRNIVFRSPRFLDLRLVCTPKTPARDRLDVWPAFPLIILSGPPPFSSGTDNIVVALGQSNRVCRVTLYGLSDSQLGEVLAPMQVPFPELSYLRLYLNNETQTPPNIPDSFLGGSAPRLEFLGWKGIPFPGLPKLLLSSYHLVNLHLYDIPHSGYFSPEAMVTLIPVLSSLEGLHLFFKSPQSRPDSETRSLPPPNRSILPALYRFRFQGVTEYLEDFVTFIDAPQLNEMNITLFNQIDFNCPRLAQFINRTPTLRALDKAHVYFYDSAASVGLRSSTSNLKYPLVDNLPICVSCREPGWQLSSMEQICNTLLHPFPSIDDLYIKHRYSELVWKDDAIENTLWLQLLLPFTAVKNLYLSKEFAPGIAAALKELVEGRITVVLPSLQNIFVQGLEASGPFQEKIGHFVAARQVSGHPISVLKWYKDSDIESVTESESATPTTSKIESDMESGIPGPKLISSGSRGVEG